MAKEKRLVVTDGVGGRSIGRAKIVNGDNGGFGAVVIEMVVNDAEVCALLQGAASYLSIAPTTALDAGITSVSRLAMDYGVLGVDAMADAIRNTTVVYDAPAVAEEVRRRRRLKRHDHDA